MYRRFSSNIAYIKSEANDGYSDDSVLNIPSWGAELTFSELIAMLNEGELVKPELLQPYAWDKLKASRFVESILLGLPVPSIILAQADSHKLIVDGHQRITAVSDFVKGTFSKDGSAFKLANSASINARWRNKSFAELSPRDQLKLQDTTVHAIIFAPLSSQDGNTGLYQIFERFNHGARPLSSKEIRSCIYQGTFNTMLFELNQSSTWRLLFGAEQANSRLLDLECILRFFALKTNEVLNCQGSQISLQQTLNEFMGKHKDAAAGVINSFKNEFNSTLHTVLDLIGKNAFKSYKSHKFSNKFHPAIFDAIMIAVFLLGQKGCSLGAVDADRHMQLLGDRDFKQATGSRTMDIANIRKRINLAGKILFGLDAL